jgi:helix-turn-helix protein
MAQQENELTEPIVKWIESEMARREWNPAELGRRSTVRPDVLSRMFNRLNRPDDETLQAVAKAFGLSLRQMQLAAFDALRGVQQNRATIPQERRAGVTGVAVAEGDEMTRHAEAQLVSDAFGRVVGKHEVVGTDLRKVLMRMAAGLDALNHHEAAGEIYTLLVELNKLDLGRDKPPTSA